MVYVEISGGLGNQLYKYATGYALSKKKKCGLTLDTTIVDTVDFRSFELDGLQVKYDRRITWKYQRGIWDRLIGNRIRKYAKIGHVTNIEERCLNGECDYEAVHKALKASDIFLEGGWQSYKYFDNYRKDLECMLVPSFELQVHTQELLHQIRNTNSVAIHVRRGDYVRLGCTLSNDYYESAVNKISQMIENPIFFVFSEDIAYCQLIFKEIPSEKVVYVRHHEKNDTIGDFYLMRNCKYDIIANSSYSWWAAYTNPFEHKIVFAPDGGSTDPLRNNLYPEDWIVL